MAANAFQLDRFWAMDQSVRLSERVVLVSGGGRRVLWNRGATVQVGEDIAADGDLVAGYSD